MDRKSPFKGKKLAAKEIMVDLSNQIYNVDGTNFLGSMPETDSPIEEVMREAFQDRG